VPGRRKVAIDVGPDDLPLAQFAERPLGGAAMGVVHLGCVDPGAPDAHSANVQGVTVDDPGPAAKLGDLDDPDVGRLPDCDPAAPGTSVLQNRRLAPDQIGRASCRERASISAGASSCPAIQAGARTRKSSTW